MTKKTNFLAMALLLALGFSWGVFTQKHRIFPYHHLNGIYRILSPGEVWSIGIYTGTSPFQLIDSKAIRNPVLRAQDVSDVEAKFVADPFMLIEGSKYYMFFEVLNKATNKGEIGLAESDNGFDWQYKSIILKEPFHLSFPYVFEWNNNIYLMPESGEDYSIRLYKASVFPTEWKYERTLIKGYRFADPTVVYYKKMWWLFVSLSDSDALYLYYSDSLEGIWIQHPKSPLITNNKHISRPAGRLILLDDKLYRFSQDCSPIYGNQVLAFEITELNADTYREMPVSTTPIIKGTKSGWNADGMHTVDPHAVGIHEWIACVDGVNY